MANPQNGVLINSGGTIVGVVQGFVGSPPTGQTFMAMDNLTGIVAGTAAPSVASQQAATILAASGAGAGIVLTCTSNAALSGTYAIDPLSQQKITAIAAAINANLGLPGGGSTFNYPDISGAPHAWTAVEFPKLAKAALNFIYALDVALAGSTSLPSTAVPIE